GEKKVILCERGIRTGADSMRFTLDLNSALVAKHDHKMPVIIDPSHTAGRRDMVSHLALGGIAIGVDGLVIEVHTNPEEEPVDKDQTITTGVFAELMEKINKIHGIVHS
ncbi:3-deoxy-7-phosphoheptulonate synthase, partial [Candidatus Roizmanbacteria bacterium]|nr:3-deoxy-7-phosphoheptulonate synthase [Candidatus Roizmanbacteria bacterium]